MSGRKGRNSRGQQQQQQQQQQQGMIMGISVPMPMPMPMPTTIGLPMGMVPSSSLPPTAATAATTTALPTTTGTSTPAGNGFDEMTVLKQEVMRMWEEYRGQRGGAVATLAAAATTATGGGGGGGGGITSSASANTNTNTIGKVVMGDTAGSLIAASAEYKLRRVIQEGLKFAAHSKRPGALRAEDVRQALRVEGHEGVYGWCCLPISSGSGGSNTTTTTNTTNTTINTNTTTNSGKKKQNQKKRQQQQQQQQGEGEDGGGGDINDEEDEGGGGGGGEEREEEGSVTAAAAAASTVNTTTTTTATTSTTTTLFNGNGEERGIRLADLRAPRRPGLITVGRHWLAIEGVQPMVPQNPPVEAVAAASVMSIPLAVQPLLPQSSSSAAGGQLFSQQQQQQQYAIEEGWTETSQLLQTLPPAKRMRGSGESGESGGGGGGGGVPVMCVLTEELNGLYERIARAVTSPESPELEADVVEGLLGNTATQQILPYLIQFVTAEVKRGGLRNPAVRRKVVTLLGKIICPEVNLSLTAPDFPDFPAAAAAAAATSTFTSASTSTPTSTMQPSQTQDAMMAEANPEAEGGSGNGSGGVSGNGYWYGGRFYIEPYMYQLVQVVLACIVTKDAECEYVDANCDATAARRDAARVLCYLCRRCYTYEGQAIAKVVTALAHVAENGARQPFARFGALVALATLGADAFAKCGLNAARDLVNAIESPSARIVPDVKAVLLAELLEYTEKALKDANATATAATVAATVTGEQVSMEERLKEMKGFILSKIEAIKKTKSEDLTASEPINEFS